MIQLIHEEIHQIIDFHIKQRHNLLFVTDANLAYYISDYLDEEYEIEDKNSELYTNCNEFYLTLHFDELRTKFYCEVAKGRNENYKLSDFDNCNYFIGTDMTDREIDDKLTGKDCEWVVFEMVDSEEESKLEDCNGCCECCSEVDLLDIYTERLQNTMGCPSCIRLILEELLDEILDDKIEN